MTIGFLSALYSVFENKSHVAIQVGVLEGSLHREVTVTLSTSDSTAIGNFKSYVVNLIGMIIYLRILI